MQLFRQELLKALLAREEISPRLVEITQNRVHSGFLPYQREAIATDDHRARRHVAGCMVLAPIALEPLRHRRETGQVIFYGRQRGCGGNDEASPTRIFSGLDFPAALCTRVPDYGQQPVRYCGAFANARRVRPLRLGAGELRLEH